MCLVLIPGVFDNDNLEIILYFFFIMKFYFK